MRAWFGLVLAVSLFASPASASPSAFVKVGWRQVSDDGLALVSGTNGLERVEFGVGVPLAERLRVELAGTYSGSSAPLFDEAAEAELRLWGVQGGARLDFPLLSWLRAFGSGGLALEFPTLWVREGGSGPSQMRLVPTARATAGAEMALALGPEEQRKTHLALTLEGGYLLSATADFDGLRNGRDEEDHPLPSQPIPVGSLNLSGWLVQLGVALRF